MKRIRTMVFRVKPGGHLLSGATTLTTIGMSAFGQPDGSREFGSYLSSGTTPADTASALAINLGFVLPEVKPENPTGWIVRAVDDCVYITILSEADVADQLPVDPLLMFSVTVAGVPVFSEAAASTAASEPIKLLYEAQQVPISRQALAFAAGVGTAIALAKKVVPQ